LRGELANQLYTILKLNEDLTIINYNNGRISDKEAATKGSDARSNVVENKQPVETL
jgi:hypothetical protein